MWQDVLLSLGTSILEHGFASVIDVKERLEMRNKLDKIIEDLFYSYEGTSIDTYEFLYLIESNEFKELLHNYFYTLKDGIGSIEYRKNLIEFISKRCEEIKENDIQSFFETVEELYFDFLTNIIEEDSELNALFQLLTISHRSIIARFSGKVDEIIKYIESTEKNKKAIDDKNIAEFHRICENEYGIIRFSGIVGAERRAEQDINTFYIPNTFSFYDVLSSETYRNNTIGIDSIGIEKIFSFGNKVVIVGGAGFGKTTTLNYLYCNYEKIFQANPLKIKIDLKAYAEEISSSKKDILSCIANQFYKKTKRSVDLDADTIEILLSRLLEEGRCLIIFDALDEIPKQAERNTVRTEIANFCDLYYLNRFVITTREVGYLKNKFDNSFVHLKIDKFSIKQIEEYSKNWFEYYHSNEKYSDFNQFWKVFSSEVDKAKCNKIIENPIILILALVIFDKNQNLPTKKIEFYARCINTFLSEREIPRSIPYLSNKAKNILGMDTVIPSIAHYRYSHMNKNSSYSFTNAEFKKSILEAIEVEEKISWMAAIDEYACYLIERTELICEVDDDVLDFAHKTFSEYFLALYFSVQMETQKLKIQLLKWIGDSNNHDLAKLIIEMLIQRGDPYKKEEIINNLFNLVNTSRGIKKQDIFRLIIDLYDENILPPKYHNKYYRTIIENGSLIRTTKFKDKKNKSSYEFNKYNAEELADVYCNMVTTPEVYRETLESLYYFGKDFRDFAIRKYDNPKLLKNTFDLFSIVRRLEYKTPNKEKVREIISYFCEYEFDCFNNNPLILATIIRAAIACDISLFNVKILTRIDMVHNSCFYTYSKPFDLISLISTSINSKELFALILYIIVICSHTGTNTMLGFIIDYFSYKAEEESEILDFVYWIWQTLNYSTEYDEFECKIKSKNLFSEEFISIYEKVFKLYNKYEVKKEDSRIIKYHKYLCKKSNEG